MRRYGSSGAVFLELRRPGILAKRRTLIPLDALDRLQADEAGPDWEGAWFHRRLRLRDIRPVCRVSYTRTARMAATSDGSVRATLDTDVQVARASGLTFEPSPGVPIGETRLILELKYRRQLPAIFKRLIATFALVPHPASKYRLGVGALKNVDFV